MQGQPPRGSPEAAVPFTSPSPPHVAVAKAENYGLQLLLVTFADFSFKVILYLTDVVLLKLILHANAANLLSFLCQWRESHCSCDAGGTIAVQSAPAWPFLWQ